MGNLGIKRRSSRGSGPFDVEFTSPLTPTKNDLRRDKKSFTIL